MSRLKYKIQNKNVFVYSKNFTDLQGFGIIIESKYEYDKFNKVLQTTLTTDVCRMDS